MRLRFFLIILAVLTCVSIMVNGIHTLLLYYERLALIDQQLRETAAALVDSELLDLRKFNIEKADTLISEELGEGRVGKFFIVRNAKDEIIYQNSNSKIEPLKNIPRQPRWIKIKTNENYIRILNLNLPRIPDRTLQVGIAMNHEFVQPRFFSAQSVFLLLTTIAVGSLASLILTSSLLKPVARLSDFVSTAANQLKTDQILSPVPRYLSDTHFLRSERIQSKDEYSRLISGFNILIEKVNKHYRNSKLWAYQMAHELKTPLTLIGLETEALQNSSANPQDQRRLASIQEELAKVSQTIGSFLSWAELEHSNRNKHLFATPLESLVKKLSQRLDSTGGRLCIDFRNDITVISNPVHLEQLILNILTNALRHSPAHSQIDVLIKDHELLINA